MIVKFEFIRKHNGEEYKFFSHIPSYDGEKGALGMEIDPYVTVETPENCFGYSDRVFLDKSYNWETRKYEEHAYTVERYLPKWILKRLEKQMITLQKKVAREYYIEQGERRQAKLSFYND